MTGPKTSPQASDETVDRLADSTEALAQEVREHRDQVCDRLKGVQDAIDELRTQVQWLCNNRPDDLRVQSMAADPLDPQWNQKLNRKLLRLACSECDCPSPVSLEEALKAGWSELMQDDTDDWEYLGLCPDCCKRDDDQVEATRQPVDWQESEAAETHYCCAVPRLCWNGHPNVPGVSCENCGFVVAEMGSLAEFGVPEEPSATETPTQPAKATKTSGTNFLWKNDE